MTRKEALAAVVREARQLIPRVDVLDITTKGVVSCTRALEQAIAALDALPPSPLPCAVKVRVAVVMEPDGKYYAEGWLLESGPPPDHAIIDSARGPMNDDIACHVGWLIGYFVPPAGAPEVDGEEEAP